MIPKQEIIKSQALFSIPSMDFSDKFPQTSHVTNIPEIPFLWHMWIFLLYNHSLVRSLNSWRGISGTLAQVYSPLKAISSHVYHRVPSPDNNLCGTILFLPPDTLLHCAINNCKLFEKIREEKTKEK